MKLRSISTSALVAISLVTAPVAAAAAPIEGTRISAPVEGEGLSGSTGAAWVVALILVGVLGILVFDDDDDQAFPVSP